MKNNTIIHGDCFEVMRSFPDKSFDHTFTSPPYNRKRNDKYKHYDDKLDDYFSFLKVAVDECLRVTKGYVFLNLQKNYYNKVEINKIIGEFANEIVEIIVWEKSNPMPAQGFSITNSWEFFLVLGDKSLKSNSTYTKNIITTSVNSSKAAAGAHSAVMKQDVADWFIEKFTQEGETILDPFLGVGTTAISCKKFMRNYVGIELQSEYVELANKRISS